MRGLAGCNASWVRVGPGSGAVSSSAATLLWVWIGVKGEFKTCETATSCGSSLEADIWFEAGVGVEYPDVLKATGSTYLDGVG